MMNITSVFEALFDAFGSGIDFLFSHGITIGGFSITFGALAVAVLIIRIVLSFLPYNDDKGGET